MKKFVLSHLFYLFILASFAKNPVIEMQLFFETDKHQLSKGSIENLESSISRLLNDKENYYIEIEGHTDTEGNLHYNQLLSEKRAYFIAKLLEGKEFNHPQIIVKASAYLNPIADNSAESGRSKNRRVEVRFFDASPVKINKIGSHQLQTERIKIDAQKDTLVTFECGIKAFIPKNSFINKNSDLVMGIVELELTPFNDFKDFILGDAPMSFLNESNDFFVSAGMFDIDATQNDEQIALTDDAYIDFDLPATSLEENMSLFEFSDPENEWLPMENELNREVQQIQKMAKRQKVVYDRRPECIDESFRAHDITDTTFFNKVMDNFQNDLIYPEIYELAQKNLSLNRLNVYLSNLKRKLTTFEVEYSIRNYENKKGQKCIGFNIGKSKNQSYNESKFLNAFYLKVNEYPSIESFSKINTVNFDGMNISIELEVNNKQELIAVKPQNIHNKRISKRLLETLENDFKRTYQNRIKMIENYHSKIEKMEQKIEEFEADIDEFTASLSNETLDRNKYLKDVCLNHKRYEIMTNEGTFGKKALDFEEFEKWVVDNFGKQYALKKKMIALNNMLKCSNSQYAMKNFRIEEYEYSYMTTPLQASLSDVRYSFRTQNLGMFNVDIFMRLENNFMVNVEKYINEKQEVIPISNLFILDENMNGAIELNTKKIGGYNLFNFPIQSENTALIAEDIHGNSYQLKKEDFKKVLENISNKKEIQLFEINENETLAMF